MNNTSRAPLVAIITSLTTLGLCLLVWFLYLRPRTDQTYPTKVWTYEYGRALRGDEISYKKYQKDHMDEAKTPEADRVLVASGMDTWYWWTGGNQSFWRAISARTAGLPVQVDLLGLLHKIPRSERFKQLGTMNDPDCVAADKPDQYGLMIDRMKKGTDDYDLQEYGWSSGIIGLRLFTNPNFKPESWDLHRYLTNPDKIEPPYLVGMACAICHVGLKPTNPPEDPAEPKWENLASVIGNQYFREGGIFAGGASSDQFLWHYAHTQQPGTSETSRFDTDFINNPNAVNSIYRLGARLQLKQAERVTPEQKMFLQSMYKNMGVPETTDFGGTDAEPTHLTPHVLKDGADSMGVPIASLRVWVNIGMMHEQWVKCWAINPFNLKESIDRGFVQKPFSISEVQKDPNGYWRKTERRLVGLEKFALTFDSYPLRSAPGGEKYLLPDNDPKMVRGKEIFADKCASCHSSKTPKNMPADEEGRQKAWRELVLNGDDGGPFLDNNYLSDDKRHPVSELHTNAARALGTNALQGQLWDNFSSKTYKSQPDARGQLQDEDEQGKPRDLYDPLSREYTRKFVVPNDRVASYRTPSLVSIWATAPYLHNNSVGTFNGDPSVAGRMAAFEDGMSKLLWPQRRLGVRSIKVTSEDCRLPDLFDVLESELRRANLPSLLPVPDMRLDLLRLSQGTPINLIANLHPKDIRAVLEAYVEGCLDGQPRERFSLLLRVNHELGHQRMLQKLLELNPCPDFIEDKGHTYGRELSDDDKRALIEFIKTF